MFVLLTRIIKQQSFRRLYLLIFERSKFRIILIRSDKVLVKQSFWHRRPQRSVRVTEWSDLSRVRLKRMILA